MANKIRIIDPAQAALFVAARQGDLEGCKRAHAAGARFDVYSNRGEYPFALAIESRNIALCSWMIDAGADMRIDHGRSSALHHAAQLNALEIGRMLIERGANIEAQTFAGTRPLHDAAGNGCVPFCELLIARGADLHASGQHSGTHAGTPLMMAAENGQLETCRMLMRAGADPRHGGSDGKTVLHGAASNGQMEVCALLLEAGVPPDAVDDNRRTALHLAAAAGRVAVCRLLVQNGANPAFTPASVTGLYYTPFQSAVVYNRLDVIRYFVAECGEDVAQRAAGGRNRTMIQITNGKETRELLRSLRTELEVVTSISELGQKDEAVTAPRSRGMAPL